MKSEGRTGLIYFLIWNSFASSWLIFVICAICKYFEFDVCYVPIYLFIIADYRLTSRDMICISIKTNVASGSMKHYNNW